MDGSAFPTALLHYVWCLYCTFFMVFALYMAHSTTKCGQHTAQILHKITNNEEDNQLLDKLSWFSRQIWHKPCRFTCGFFDIDWTLAFAVTRILIVVFCGFPVISCAFCFSDDWEHHNLFGLFESERLIAVSQLQVYFHF